MADAETVDLVVKLIGGGGLGTFCTYVAVQLRDQTRIMREESAARVNLFASLSRKLARIEVLAIGTFEAVTGKRVMRAATSPVGVPVMPRSRTESDDPGIAVARTMTEDEPGDG